MIADHKESDGTVYRAKVEDGKTRFQVAADGKFRAIAKSKVPDRIRRVLLASLDEQA